MRGAGWRPARWCAGTVGLCALAALWWVLLPAEPADAQRAASVAAAFAPAPFPAASALILEQGAARAVLPVGGAETSTWLLILGVAEPGGPARTIRVRVKDASRSRVNLTEPGRDLLPSALAWAAVRHRDRAIKPTEPSSGRRGVLRSVASATAGGAGDQPARPPGDSLESHQQPEPHPALPERTFFVLKRGGDPARLEDQERVEASLVAAGERIEIYADPLDRDQVDPGLAESLVATYDQELADRLGDLVGPIADVDENGRLTVLLTSRLDRLAGSSEPLDGCVRAQDYLPGVRAPLGNQCDLIYMNVRMRSSAHARTILAHEAAHAAVLSARIVRAGCGATLQDEEAWLDEGIAHAVEDQLAYAHSNLDHREQAFRDAPALYRLVVPDYQAAGLYRSPGHRGATARFVSWCADEYGSDVLMRLALSHLRGIANLEAATGARFETLFRNWSLAQAVQWAAQPRLGSARAGSAGGIPVLYVADGQPVERTVAIEPTAFHAVLITAPPSGPVPGKLELELQGDPDTIWQATLAPAGAFQRIPATGLAMGSTAD